MPVAHCQALCWVLQIQGRCGPLIVELAVFRNQERKCYVDKAREKCEGIRTHLLWLISLPGKGGEGGELQVWFKEAKNLTAAKLGGTSDSFVKG